MDWDLEQITSNHHSWNEHAQISKTIPYVLVKTEKVPWNLSLIVINLNFIFVNWGKIRWHLRYHQMWLWCRYGSFNYFVVEIEKQTRALSGNKELWEVIAPIEADYLDDLISRSNTFSGKPTIPELLTFLRPYSQKAMRKQQLVTELTKRGLRLRSDSRLCRSISLLCIDNLFYTIFYSNALLLAWELYLEMKTLKQVSQSFLEKQRKDNLTNHW